MFDRQGCGGLPLVWSSSVSICVQLWLTAWRGVSAGLRWELEPPTSPPMESLSSLLPIIQLAITPVILISGMGALMITLTNRMARIVDRTRQLAELIPQADADERQHLEDQLHIMWRRTLMIRRAVTSNGLSMLVSCLLIVVLFAAAMFDWNMRAVVLVLFAASIVLLTASLVDFLRDIFVSLHALQLQVARARQKPATRAPWGGGPRAP
jgi:hypothetical protein